MAAAAAGSLRRAQSSGSSGSKKDEDEEILLPVSPVVKGTGSNALPRHNGGSKAAPGRPASNGTAAAPSRGAHTADFYSSADFVGNSSGGSLNGSVAGSVASAGSYDKGSLTTEHLDEVNALARRMQDSGEW